MSDQAQSVDAWIDRALDHIVDVDTIDEVVRNMPPPDHQAWKSASAIRYGKWIVYVSGDTLLVNELSHYQVYACLTSQRKKTGDGRLLQGHWRRHTRRYRDNDKEYTFIQVRLVYHGTVHMWAERAVDQ